MIKWIHQNKRSITVFLVASVVVLSMSFFGVNIGATRKERYAIKIGSETLSFEEFQNERKERQEMMIQQYKKILGKNFSKFAQQIYNIKNSDIADSIIEKKLALQEAKRLNLYVGEEQMDRFLKEDVFGGNFSSAAYAAYLTQSGQTAPAFEAKLKQELLIDNYRSILADFAAPSRQEVENYIKNKETTYDINYIEFDPKNYEDKVKAEDAELEKYFNSNQTDFEIPAKISYNYTVLNPENSMSLVDISQDDIEFYYSENESKFKTAEQAKVRQILINIPKDAEPAKLDEIKKKAGEAHSKASAGENFELLVPQYTDDILSAGKNGDLGWITKGKLDKQVESAVFALKGKGLAPLVTTDNAYYIIKVEDYKEPELKKLEEVKSQIESDLRKREAPAFISAKAHDIFDKWEKGGAGSPEKSLKDLSAENKLSYSAPGKAFTQSEDPDPKLRGLTKSILQFPSLKKQIIDLGDNTVLVEVEKYEETKTPAFSEAKNDVITKYKKLKAKELASEAAQSFYEKSASQENSKLSDLAKSSNLKLEEKKGLSKAKPESGIFSNPDVTSVIFSASNKEKPTAPVVSEDKYYIFSTVNIIPPNIKLIKEKFKNYEQQAAMESAKTLFESNINRLKAKSDIDIDKNLLADNSHPDIS